MTGGYLDGRNGFMRRVLFAVFGIAATGQTDILVMPDVMGKTLKRKKENPCAGFFHSD